jgi:hypothetical protein
MKSALICTPNETIRCGLQASLAEAAFAVSHVDRQGDIARALKQSNFDLLISEAPKSSFSELLKLSIVLNPLINVYVMNNGQIFCFYPYRRQSVDVINAIMNAGIKISHQLLRHTNPDLPTPGDVVILP